MRRHYKPTRQVIVQQITEAENQHRTERLVTLLSLGLERLLSEERQLNQQSKPDDVLDFHADVLPNVQDVTRIANTENK
jgi:hypothetical protein